MRRALVAALVVTTAVAVVGCSNGTKDLLGQGKRPPDEFAVYSRAPLSLPPGYGERPGADQSLPAPGTSASQAAVPGPETEARNVILGAGAAKAAPGVPTATAAAPPPTTAASPGTLALMQRTGATQVNPDIRATVDRETQLLADADQTFVERLMFWRKPTDYGSVVNPAAEASRIQETQAMGEPIVAGATPTIERRRKALLEGIFN
jgi:hypothetical protein